MPVAHAFIVDDEAPVRKSLGRVLHVLGIPSSGYESAEAFLEAWRPDLAGCLLVDIRMPGMNGLDMIEELQRRGSRIPAIVITGHTDETSVTRLTALGAVGLLEKPFSLSQLKDMLSRVSS
jgi:two-component system response regulator DctR